MRLGLGTAMALAALMICLGLLPLQPALTTPNGGVPSRPDASPHTSPWREGGRWVRTGLAAWTNALLSPPGPAGRLVAGTAAGLYLSSDGGATWRRAESAVPIAALAASVDGGTVYAGGADGAVYALDNPWERDQRWRRISARLSPDAIFSLAAAPSDGRVLLAGSTGALYRGVATPAGWRWRRVARSGEAAFSTVAWAPWNARVAVAAVFAATPAVLVSRDDGATWRAETEGLPASLPSETLLPITAPAPAIVLSTMGGGVWQRGATGGWRDISAGLPERHAMSLVTGAADGSGPLYAGTMGNGVYVRDGAAPWRRLGRGLNGGAYTVLVLARVAGPRPALLAGTARGVFRYAPP